MSIDWKPIDEVPDDRKDGRELLLWNRAAIIGAWSTGPGWWDEGGSGWVSMAEGSPIDDVVAWADITAPAR